MKEKQTMNKTELKKRITTINPEITEELLELLCAYVKADIKEESSYEKMSEQLKNDESFENVMKSITRKI